MINILMFMFCSGVLCLLLVRSHVFLCLISLEFIILYLLLSLYIYCLILCSSVYLYILLMTFYVCEGSLGLSLIVLMIKCHSNDFLNSMMLW